MEKYNRSQRISGIIALATVISMLTLAYLPMVNTATERVENIDAIMFNQARDTDITINMADPEITMADMWPDRPAGIYYGPTTPGSIYDTKDWIVSENDYATAGWFFEVSDSIVMSGASEMWLKGPIVTDPSYVKTSNLKIYEISDYNFTISSLTEPICDYTIYPTQLDPVTVGDGYMGQLANWGTLTSLDNGPGATLSNRYFTFFDVFAPIYPNTKYFITQNVTYQAPTTPFHPEISLSNEDIAYDEVAFTYYSSSGASDTNTNFPLDPDSCVVFVNGQTQGRAMVPMALNPGDYFYYYTIIGLTGYEQRIIPLYPEGGPSNWTVSVDTFPAQSRLKNVTISDGGILYSPQDWGIVGPLASVRIKVKYNFRYDTGNQSINAYLPCIENTTSIIGTTGHNQIYLFNGTNNKTYFWTYGAMSFTMGTRVNITQNLYVGYLANTFAVNYTRFAPKSIFSFMSGHGKNEDGTLWTGAKKVIQFTGGLIWESTGIPDGVDAIKTAWQGYKDGTLTPENIQKVLSEFAGDVFTQIGGAFQNMYNQTTTFIEDFIIGEFVDKVQTAWGTFTDWIGNKLEDYLSPVIEVFHELKAIVTDVVNALLDGFEYALSIGMKISSTLFMAFQIPLIIGVGAVIILVPRFTRRNNPGSDQYRELRNDWKRHRGEK